MSEKPYLSIREVLDLLVAEFPDVTISKIRFLESRGLIHPERTPSGYRKFSASDVERLAWILRQQREHFLPLKVIKGRLEAANGNEVSETVEASLFDDDPGDEPPVTPHRLVRSAEGIAAGTAKGAHGEDEAASTSPLRLMGTLEARRELPGRHVGATSAPEVVDVSARSEDLVAAIAGAGTAAEHVGTEALANGRRPRHLAVSRDAERRRDEPNVTRERQSVSRNGHPSSMELAGSTPSGAQRASDSTRRQLASSSRTDSLNPDSLRALRASTRTRW